MKTKILFIATILFTVQLTSAQVLWSENFDFLTLGNVGTDDTGTTPGQGGWYTMPYNQDNNYFKIIAEPGRGNVMELIAPQSQNMNQNKIQKRGVADLWNTRISGNDILKIEYDFFTGSYDITASSYTYYFSINSDDNFTGYGPTNSNYIASIVYSLNAGHIFPAGSLVQKFYYISSQQIPVLNNTWVKIAMYFDYPNQKIYFALPSLGVLMAYDSPNNIPLVNSLVFIAGATGLSPSFLSSCKYDNFVISAVNSVPLSVKNNFISSKFNVFPNPANDIVTITNSENIGIEQIEVFDMSGKAIQSQLFNNENEVQLTIEDLAPGIYMLYIKAKEGTAVKKITKK